MHQVAECGSWRVRAGTHPLRASVPLTLDGCGGVRSESSADLMDILRNFLQKTSRKEQFLIT